MRSRKLFPRAYSSEQLIWGATHVSRVNRLHQAMGRGDFRKIRHTRPPERSANETREEEDYRET